MRTIAFTTLLESVALALGLEPASLTSAQKARILASINRHIKTGWKHDFWPELTPSEQRAFRPIWDEETLFDAGTIVYYADADLYYEANEAPNNPQDGESPALYPAKWTEISDFRRYVALDQEGETPIDEVEGVYQCDPRLRPNTAGRVLFAFSPEGIVPISSCGNLVWVRFRVRPSQFSLTAFSAASTYAEGAIVISPAGECYKARTAVPADSELTDSIYWEHQPLPTILEGYLTHMAAGDLLRADGQPAQARVEHAEAELKLLTAHDEQFAGQGQYDTAQVRSY